MKVFNFTIGISLLLCGCTKLNQSYKNKESLKSSSNKIERVVTLTSLSTDIVSALSRDKLVAIPGSSLFKGKIDYQELPRICLLYTSPSPRDS